MQLLAALYVFVKWVLGGIFLKVIVFSVLFFVISEFVPLLVGLIPGLNSITTLFQSIPPEMLFLVHYFEIPAGISMFVSAASTAFIIRRIPIIG